VKSITTPMHGEGRDPRAESFNLGCGVSVAALAQNLNSNRNK
jgi:hypothetical protein